MKGNHYPVYIVSKGRPDSRLTSKALERMSVDYHIIVEDKEYETYASVIDPNKILVLPDRYFEEYDVCDDLGRTKSTGPGPARNFAWDHSTELGAKRHWVMDDNIRKFYRFNRNEFYVVKSPVYFTVMEDFCDRYTNVGMAGPDYFMFVSRREVHPPFVLNTRIYSCNLIENALPYRWRGRYNEDTDLSLRMLKDGLCTILFKAYQQEKMTTQMIKGGNTKEFYDKEGTYNKSAMQVKLHPDVSKIVYRFNRIHHLVDYKPFKRNPLKKNRNEKVSPQGNEYGMKLIKVDN